MFSMTPWDVVRPSYWYPMSSLEQSMMDFEQMADEMLGRSRFMPLRTTTSSLFPRSPMPVAEEEFFKDLPFALTEKEQETPETEVEAEAETEGTRRRAFSNYAYSSSSVLDEKGQRVETFRRRYEDSTGRLKAVHQRKIGNKMLKTTWDRSNKEDKGEHSQICSSGTAEEFEKMWANTPFGKAEKEKQATLTAGTKEGGTAMETAA